MSGTTDAMEARTPDILSHAGGKCSTASTASLRARGRVRAPVCGNFFWGSASPVWGSASPIWETFPKSAPAGARAPAQGRTSPYCPSGTCSQRGSRGLREWARPRRVPGAVRQRGSWPRVRRGMPRSTPALPASGGGRMLHLERLVLSATPSTVADTRWACHRVWCGSVRTLPAVEFIPIKLSLWGLYRMHVKSGHSATCPEI